MRATETKVKHHNQKRDALYIVLDARIFIIKRKDFEKVKVVREGGIEPPTSRV